MNAVAPGSARQPGALSIVIKAFNEEAKIARAIESALAAAAELQPRAVEVVVADSCSTDRTAAIACAYPVRLVQLAHARERGCGIGQQLGYAWSRGDWVCFMDGDMALSSGFLADALARLEQDDTLAGVGGAVIDERIANVVDRIRVNNRSGMRVGVVAWLNGSGLYRRSAIEAAGGYAADRNLKAHEEAELGLRLHAAGYRLERLARQAVSHVGHASGTWSLLGRHWRSGRAMAAGVLLRSAIGRPWFRRVLWIHRHALATVLYWLLLPLGLWLVPPAARVALAGAWLGGWAALLLLLACLKRDLQHAVVSLASWHYVAAAIVVGCFEPHLSPRQPIDATLLNDEGHA